MEKQLKSSGFVIASASDVATLSDRMHEVGASLGNRTTELGLIGFSDDKPLGIHSETIYAERLCRYFLLGCVQPAESGGESQIYDAVATADILMRDFPELGKVKITYGMPGASQTTKVSLISTNQTLGDRPVLQYRQNFYLDTPNNLPEEIDRDTFTG